jgi:hypothetical protein
MVEKIKRQNSWAAILPFRKTKSQRQDCNTVIIGRELLYCYLLSVVSVFLMSDFKKKFYVFS